MGNVIKSLHREVLCWHITDLYMKVSSSLVISVIIKLHNRVIFVHIFSLNMKVLSILVISVIISPSGSKVITDIRPHVMKGKFLWMNKHALHHQFKFFGMTLPINPATFFFLPEVSRLYRTDIGIFFKIDFITKML